jgi:hypothetical protein
VFAIVGFVKILKKHDKISPGLKRSSDIVIPIVHNSVFWRSHAAVQKLMQSTEEFYVEAFAALGLENEGGLTSASGEMVTEEEMHARRKAAATKLRGAPAKVSHWVTFKFGACFQFIRAAAAQARLELTLIASCIGAGVCVGVSIAALIAIIMVWRYSPSFAYSPLFLYSFPVFRGIAFILIAIWCWGLVVYAFQHYKYVSSFLLIT